MAFALTATALTQTGTDTSLAGIGTMIAAIPTVAITTAYALGNYIKPPSPNGFIYRCTVAGTTMAVSPTYGTTAGGTTVDGTASFLAIIAPYAQVNGNRTIYRISTFQAAFSGTLTWDAKLEGLEFYNCATSPVVSFNSPAVITMNSLINGKPTYEEAIVIRANSNSINTEIRSNVGATLNINGAKIVVSGIGGSNYQSVYFDKGSTLNITDGWLKSSRNQVRVGELGTGNMLAFNINRLIVEKIGFTIFNVLGNLQGLSPLGSSVQIVAYGAYTTITVKDFNPLESSSSVDNWDIQNVFLDNAVSSNITILGGGQNGIARWATMRKDVIVQVLNASNAPIQNAISYIRDTNNGGRIEVLGIANQLSDNIYLQTTAASGLTPSFKVYVLHGKTTTGTSVAVIRDYRSKTTVAGADLFDIHTWAYGSVYKALNNTPLLGTGTITVQSVLLDDANVTLSEAAAVAKLASSFMVAGNVLTVTANSTLDDVYDALKAYKTRPVQAQVEYPAIGTQPVTAAGTQLTTAMSIVVNAGVALTAGAKFKGVTCAGVTVLGTITTVSIVGNVTQATPSSLTEVSITGTLTYNMAANTSVTFTNSTLAAVANSGAGIVTVKRVNSTLTPGINVVAYVPTVLSFALNGGRIRVLDHLGVEQYNQTADGTFELPAAATGTWSYKVAKYGSKPIEATFAINGTTIAISPAYIPDPVVVDTLANVSAYTALETTQKVYDYYSLYLASVTGVLQTKSITLTPSLLDLGAYNLALGALAITATAINTNSAAISGVNITTTGTVGTFLPTYPQQIASPSGSTNWLRITPTIGQVYLDSVNSAYSAAAATTLLPATFSSAITIFVTRRGYKKQVVTVPYTAGLLATQSFVLIPDTNVLDPVTDFTLADLTNSQLIYDAFSQYQSSAAGITDVYVPTKTPGAIAFGAKGFALALATDMALSPLQIKSSALTSDTYYSDASFTQGAATLANLVLIRASTLNSEIVFTPDSITFYPSQAARDSGTTPGLTVTGGVYRFLHGSTVSGVVMSGTLYLRVTVGSIVFFSDLPIVSGANVLDLGVQGQLTAISAKVDQAPLKVWSEPLDGSISARRLVQATAAALAGKATGGGTDTITIRNLSDTADALTMTVDLNGNRSATIVP